jgi:hypothetical protein
MNYNNFESEILSRIQKNKKCKKIIEQNKKLINEYFINCDSTVINGFIYKLIDTIFVCKKYDEAENFLKNPLMKNVLEAFKESIVLVRAFKEQNKYVAKWLMNMNINFNQYTHDKKGMTALMHACRYYKFVPYVETIIEKNKDILNLVDEDGNNALFHSIKIREAFNILLTKKVDINHRNQNGDNIFTHICKNRRIMLIKTLLENYPNIDLTVVNNEGMTGAMYIAESDNYTELRGLYASKRDLNLNYLNKNGETIVSQTINRYYREFKDCDFPYATEYSEQFYNTPEEFQAKFIARTINALIDIGCDFNCAIDGDGNTPLMFFIMIKDFVSALNLLKYCKTLDLYKCNKYGISASYLCHVLKPSEFDSLKRVKNYIYMKIDYHKFWREFSNYNGVYIKDNTEKYDKPIIHPYIVPKKILSLQAALSEGYLARSGEDGKDDLFDKMFRSPDLLRYGHPIRYR